MRDKITKTSVDRAKPGNRDRFIWDEDVTGFGMKVTPRGKKVYIVQFRFDGKPERVTIGKHGSPWTPDTARKKAKEFLGQAANGINPAQAKRDAKSAITVKELCALYLEEGCGHKKASTLETDRGRINRHIIPLLGRKRVKDITPNDVKRFMRDIERGKTAVDERTKKRGRARVTGGGGTAARTVGLLGGIFTFAIGEGILTHNPVRGMKRPTDKQVKRYLTPAELAALSEALADAEKDGEHESAINAIRLLLFTGARKSEILTLRWEHVDLDAGMIRLPDSKTGEKDIPLATPALEILSSITPEKGNPYVLPGSKEKHHLVGLPRIWKRIRERATVLLWKKLPDTKQLIEKYVEKSSDTPHLRGLKEAALKAKIDLPVGLQDVRLHDLRHTFASVALGSGLNLSMIGKLLGHKDPKTTERYAHLMEDPAKEAMNRTAGSIHDAMSGGAE